MKKIGLGIAHVTPRGKKYVNQVLRSSRLTYGEFSKKFENGFAHAHGAQYGIVSNSGTSSLQVALHALKYLYKWEGSDEIIVPATTFVASANVILQNGLTPKFVDVDPAYFALDPLKLERAITKRTKAIMVVHLFGQSSPMKLIMPLVNKYKLKLIEDSCETMFAHHDGRPVGSWGDVACFSTYAAHLITTGVGGIAITNNKKLAVLMKSLCNHGRDKIYLSIDDDDKIKSADFAFVLARRFKFIYPGYSYRITEMEAALGLAQLEEYKKIINPRKRNGTYLAQCMSDLTRFFQLPAIHPNSEHVFMVFPLVVRDRRIKLPELLYYLEQKGIETRYLVPLINQPVYKHLKINTATLPVAKRLLTTGFYVGCHQGLSKQDMEYISDALHAFVEKLP